MSTIIPDLAIKRYSEFIESFNKFNLIDYKVDANSKDNKDKLLNFYTKISSDEKLFKYLLTKDKLLFHKNYKIVFIPKINFYNLIESNIDESLISFVWETVQMIYLIISDGQNELSKKQGQINALLDKLDGLGKKKGAIDLKKTKGFYGLVFPGASQNHLSTRSARLLSWLHWSARRHILGGVDLWD